MGGIAERSEMEIGNGIGPKVFEESLKDKKENQPVNGDSGRKIVKIEYTRFSP